MSAPARGARMKTAGAAGARSGALPAGFLHLARHACHRAHRRAHRAACSPWRARVCWWISGLTWCALRCFCCGSGSASAGASVRAARPARTAERGRRFRRGDGAHHGRGGVRSRCAFIFIGRTRMVIDSGGAELFPPNAARFALRNAWIGLIITGLALRYFYVAHSGAAASSCARRRACMHCRRASARTSSSTA